MSMWGANGGNEIFFRQSPHVPWEKVGGAAKQIAASNNGQHVVCVNTSDEVYHMTGRHGHWERLDGALKHICAADNGQLWGVNSGDQIYYKANPYVAALLCRSWRTATEHDLLYFCLHDAWCSCDCAGTPGGSRWVAPPSRSAATLAATTSSAATPVTRSTT